MSDNHPHIITGPGGDYRKAHYLKPRPERDIDDSPTGATALYVVASVVCAIGVLIGFVIGRFG